jgi:hypothetical protein
MYLAQGDMKSTAEAVLKITEDPHLNEVACHVLRLNRIEEGKDPGPECPRVATSYRLGKGIGLRHAVGPLRFFVKTRENPWITYAALAGALGAVFAAGYFVGAAKKKRRK